MEAKTVSWRLLNQWLHLLLWMVKLVFSGSHAQEHCMTETFHAECPHGEVVIMEKAEFGRMTTGRCLTSDMGHIGCVNDVLYLVDQWCSGQRKCDFAVTNLDSANKHCNKELRFYLRASYSCLTYTTRNFSYCSSHTKIPLKSPEGFLSSHVTDETGCGSQTVPWQLEAQSGQTLQLNMFDFSALSRSENAISSEREKCSFVIGYVIERSVGVNESLCAGADRKRKLYETKTNKLEIYFLSLQQRGNEERFLISFQTIGCSDMTPPAHAWYKRNGEKATIGCDVGDRAWHLQCVNNRWQGVVGNCTLAVAAASSQEEVFPIATVLTLVAIISGTICLALFVLGLGRCYIKKYRGNRPSKTQKTNSKSKTGTKDCNGSSHYRPMSYTDNYDNKTADKRAPPPRPPRRPTPSNTARSTANNTARHTRNLSTATVNSTNSSRYYSDILEAHSLQAITATCTNARSTSRESGYLTPTLCTANQNQSQGGLPHSTGTVTSHDSGESRVSGYYSPNTGHKYYVLDKEYIENKLKIKH